MAPVYLPIPYPLMPHPIPCKSIPHCQLPSSQPSYVAPLTIPILPLHSPTNPTVNTHPPPLPISPPHPPPTPPPPHPAHTTTRTHRPAAPSPVHTHTRGDDGTYGLRAWRAYSRRKKRPTCPWFGASRAVRGRLAVPDWHCNDHDATEARPQRLHSTPAIKEGLPHT